jgi:iron-sulfur cluster repair protein YtfE (RIC family)
MEDAVDRLVQTRMANAVQTSINIRVRLSQRISTICRDVIASYLEDERQAVSAVFASEDIKDEFGQRHEQARKLLDELDELNPTQNNGLAILAQLVNDLNEYVHWEDEILYPSIQSMVQDAEVLPGVVVAQPSEPII